jgi:glycosyltransferase involved in cell wall biosynthesis
MNSILFISHTTKIAGAEAVLLKIISCIFNENKKSKIFVVEPLDKGVSLFKRELYDIGIVQIWRLPYKNIGGSLLRTMLVFLLNIYCVLVLVYRIRKEHINIIYSNTSIVCVGVIAAFLTKKRHIWHFHETFDFDEFRDKNLVYIYKLLTGYKKNSFVFISTEQRKSWELHLRKKIQNFRIIYNPTKEITCSSPSRKNSLVIFGYLGGLGKRKNVVSLINAFSLLRRKHTNAKLIIGGSGDQEGIIQEFIKKYSLQNIVELMGQISDVSAFYSGIDVLVLPSFYESFGLVVIEAMLAQRAVLVTKNTGLHELFENKKECLFFNPYDEFELIENMEILMDNNFRISLALNGYEKAKQYDFNTSFVDSIHKLFE